MPVFVRQSYKQNPNYNNSKSSWHNFESELQFCFRMAHTIECIEYQGINLLHIHTLTSESPLIKTFLVIALFHNSFFQNSIATSRRQRADLLRPKMTTSTGHDAKEARRLLAQDLLLIIPLEAVGYKADFCLRGCLWKKPLTQFRVKKKFA